MRLVSIAIVMGLVLLYFVNAALKIDIFNWEMLIHSGIRFFTGFIILGISCFYGHKIKLKIAVYLVLALVLADDIMDYYRQVNSFSAEFMVHGAYMLLWGALVGYLSMRYVKGKTDSQL